MESHLISLYAKRYIEERIESWNEILEFHKENSGNEHLISDAIKQIKNYEKEIDEIKDWIKKEMKKA